MNSQSFICIDIVVYKPNKTKTEYLFGIIGNGMELNDMDVVCLICVHFKFNHSNSMLQSQNQTEPNRTKQMLEVMKFIRNIKHNLRFIWNNIVNIKQKKERSHTETEHFFLDFQP